MDWHFLVLMPTGDHGVFKRIGMMVCSFDGHSGGVDGGGIEILKTADQARDIMMTRTSDSWDGGVIEIV